MGNIVIHFQYTVLPEVNLFQFVGLGVVSVQFCDALHTKNSHN